MAVTFSPPLSAPMVALALGAALMCAAAPTLAASQVFTCVAASGRTLTSDRLIGECMDREQRVLSREGLLLRIVPPSLTAEERAARDARERRAAAEKEARAEAVRRDRVLLQRYPDVDVHQKAREAALADVRASMSQSAKRQKELADERKPLLEEAEFYKGKPLPSKLRQQLDANEAASDAQRDVQHNQTAELDRVNRVFDVELARLRRLWAGAAPGTLGPATPEVATATAVPAAPAKSVSARGGR